MLIGRSDLTTTSLFIVTNYDIIYQLIVVLNVHEIIFGISFMSNICLYLFLLKMCLILPYVFIKY